MQNRDIKFGRLLAIANILSERVFEKKKLSISQKHMSRYNNKPALTFGKIHTELMEYADKFGPNEITLMDLFNEIIGTMDESDFTNEPLTGKYLLGYHTEQDALHTVVGVEDASLLWGLSPGYIKNLCAEGKVICKKVGGTWIIDKSQPNPKSSE